MDSPATITAVGFQYDENGNRTQSRIGNQVTQYQYDALDRLTQMTDAAGGITQYSYTALNKHRDNHSKENATEPFIMSLLSDMIISFYFDDLSI